MGDVFVTRLAYRKFSLIASGGPFYDRWRQLVLAAIDTCLDEVLALEDD
jgi:hypothetical protein